MKESEALADSFLETEINEGSLSSIRNSSNSSHPSSSGLATSFSEYKKNDKQLSEEQTQLAKINDYIKQPSIKRLIATILAQQEEKGFKSIAVVSEMPQEGRSFITSLVAFCYAQMYQKRVIIVDLSNPNKLNEWHFVNLFSIAQPNQISTYASGIHLLVAKPQNDKNCEIKETPPQQDLFKVLLESLKPSYDLILIDTNAMAEKTSDKPDSILSAKLADRSVLVLTQKTLTREKLIQVKERIKSAGIEVLGTIHNR
jgi:Mrp family chromosome partitioning ATPase